MFLVLGLDRTTIKMEHFSHSKQEFSRFVTGENDDGDDHENAVGDGSNRRDAAGTGCGSCGSGSGG